MKILKAHAFNLGKKKITVGQTAAGVLALIIIIWGGKKVLNLLKPSEQRQQGKALTSETIQSQLTHTPAEFEILADSLEEAMTTMGAENDQVLEVIGKMNTKSDVLKLISTFGERTNYFFGIPKYTRGLAVWLNEEFGEDTMKEINGLMASKGINFSF